MNFVVYMLLAVVKSNSPSTIESINTANSNKQQNSKEKEIILSEKEVKCLTETIYYEARGESNKGKLAVANVVINRMENKSFPDTVCSVVYQKKQFSWTKNKYKIKEWDAWEESKEMATEILKDHYEGERVDNAKGSLYFSTGYHHKGTKKVAKIDSHVFFK